MDTGSLREFGVVTVRDVLSIALPPGSEVVAGTKGIGREVTWATRLRATMPAFAHISRGEAIILDPAVLEIIDDGQGAPSGRAVDTRPEGRGIRGMRDRATLIGGTLITGPEGGHDRSGFAVRATLPLGEAT